MATLLIDHSPFLANDSQLQPSWVTALLGLSDGSFVSCAQNIVTRWRMSSSTDSDNNNSLDRVGTFEGHTGWVVGVVEKDGNTLVTASRDRTIMEWDITTFECLKLHNVSSELYCAMKTRDNMILICGTNNGRVELRRLNDLVLISSFSVHSDGTCCICELEDGSFVSGSYDNTIKRWKAEAKSVIQAFCGHLSSVQIVLGLKRDYFVSASVDQTIKIWQISTGECLCTLSLHTSMIYGLVKLSNSKFASASWDKTIRVWDERGYCIETITTDAPIKEMAKVNNFLVTATSFGRFEVRRLK